MVVWLVVWLVCLFYLYAAHLTPAHFFRLFLSLWQLATYLRFSAFEDFGLRRAYHLTPMNIDSYCGIFDCYIIVIQASSFPRGTINNI